MSNFYKKQFIVIQDERQQYDDMKVAQNRETEQSPLWRDADGKELNSDTLASEVYIDESGNNGYFFLPHEHGGFSIYQIFLHTFRCVLASQPKQFVLAGDPDAICEMLARERTTVDYVKEAGRKGKGTSAAAVTLFTRNKSRSDSLVDYRKKMRTRQFPLKKDKQWEFLVGLAENGQLKPKAIEQVLYMVREADHVRECRAGEPDVPEGWTQNDGAAKYIAEAVEG